MTRRAPTVGRRDERGFVAGAEALVFGALVVVTGTLVLVAAWGVLTTRAALGDASREYLRAYTEADSPASALLAGRSAATASLVGDGIEPGAVTIVDPDTSRFGPCSEATVELRAVRPGIRLPFVADFGTVDVDVVHRELVDPLREMDAGDRYDPGTTPCDD